MKRKISSPQPVDRARAREAPARSRIGRATAQPHVDRPEDAEANRDPHRAREGAASADRLRQARESLKLEELAAERTRRAARGSRAARVERIDHISELMALNLWKGTSAHRKEIADAFGVTLETIKDDAAEAARRVMRLVDGDQDLKKKMEFVLDAFLQDMLDVRRTGSDVVRTRAAEAARGLIATWNGMRGLDAPKQVKVDGALASLLGKGLSPDQPPEEDPAD